MAEKASASLSALAHRSVGLTVTPMDDGYFVTAFRSWTQRDEERVSFRVTAETFLAFADAIAELANAERLRAEGKAQIVPETEPGA